MNLSIKVVKVQPITQLTAKVYIHADILQIVKDYFLKKVLTFIFILISKYPNKPSFILVQNSIFYIYLTYFLLKIMKSF